MTPREFYILLEEEQEFKLDQLEMQALQAFMNEKAARIEKLKLKDIYERPTNAQLVAPQKTEDEIREAQLRRQRENDALLGRIQVHKNT
ncbi:hypothetical protein [Paenilisteria rocourtiae]|uniref:Uncharacterized protein n=1 Tax=Listeria rocourtiae TaxID=647910 RepID=A0A4R6ZSI5_9LIST|nr:hypothetical protein [Listeria rocourtiae]TDR55109.1 hypothetical protein DFP96_10137 [Listeria rocourtiae]